jgi:hypothetical protein
VVGVTWTKLGDEFAGETARLSDAAFRTHVEALIWSNHRLLDLMIPQRDVRRLAETLDMDEAVKELIESGWWEERGDAYWIGCRFPHWQQDKVQIDHRRAMWAEDQRRSRRHRLDDHSLCSPGTGTTPKNCASALVSVPDSAPDSGPDPVSVSASGRATTATTGNLENRPSTASPGRVVVGPRAEPASASTARAATAVGGDEMQAERRAALEAERDAHLASEEAWYRDTSLEYATTPGGTKFHFVTCKSVQSAVRAAERGDARYPLRLSMTDVNAQNLHPCGVCIGGYDPLEKKRA